VLATDPSFVVNGKQSLIVVGLTIGIIPLAHALRGFLKYLEYGVLFAFLLNVHIRHRRALKKYFKELETGLALKK